MASSHSWVSFYDQDTVLTEKSVSAEELEQWFPTAYDRLSPQVEDHGALDGYELVEGPLTSLVFEASGQKALTLTQEFGTIPGVLVARALVLENMLHHYSSDESDTRGRSWLQAAFYPQSTRWRASIVKRGVALAFQSMDVLVQQQPR